MMNVNVPLELSVGDHQALSMISHIQIKSSHSLVIYYCVLFTALTALLQKKQEEVRKLTSNREMWGNLRKDFGEFVAVRAIVTFSF
jgi:hypothetical protein